MYKLSLCFIAAIVILSIGAPAQARSTEQREITVVKDVRSFLQKHPGLKVTRLTRLQQPATHAAGSQSVTYTLGGHVSGDRLVAQSADVFAYPASKDVSIQLTYPESGNGAIVTYVQITCTQDNVDGNAYVIAGGIGQRFISIVLEANQTQNFSYQAQYYGSD